MPLPSLLSHSLGGRRDSRWRGGRRAGRRHRRRLWQLRLRWRERRLRRIALAMRRLVRRLRSLVRRLVQRPRATREELLEAAARRVPPSVTSIGSASARGPRRMPVSTVLREALPPAPQAPLKGRAARRAEENSAIGETPARSGSEARVRQRWRNPYPHADCQTERDEPDTIGTRPTGRAYVV